MPQDFRDPPVTMAWHAVQATDDAGDIGDVGLWLTGGGSLLAWTALALLLTAA